ncbi:hypothetical protein BH10PSE1_BH10PSE1_16500 [soil metagenome]
MSALPLPDGVDANSADPNVVELIRVWWNGNHPDMIIRPALQQPSIVGSILGELAWHFSNAYAEKSGLPREETLDIIQKQFLEAMRVIPLDGAETSQ